MPSASLLPPAPWPDVLGQPQSLAPATGKPVESTTDARGSFTIGHVPAGTFGVLAEHQAHLSEFRTPLVVERRQYTEAGESFLKDAPTLRGVVTFTVRSPM